MCTSKIYLNT